MLKNKLLVAALASAFSLPVLAADAPAVTGNVSLVSNYLYRGMSQTGNKPAIQGGFDYAHSSGFYAGAWGSNISWLSDSGTADNASLELDTYAGFKGGIVEDVTYDVGFLRYNYPGNYAAGAITANTNEIYGAVSYKWVTAKYSRSSGNLFGVADSSGSGYMDLSASYSIENSGVTVGAHYGKQTVANHSAADYTDYSLKVVKDFSGFGLGLTYSKTNLTVIDVQGNELGRGTVVLSVSHSM
jgi:uncharacterized protein (TIGR02001 family)